MSDETSTDVFTRADGVWSEQVKLLASDGVGTDHFGADVALDGDTLVIGANGDMDDPGSAYVFSRTGDVWTEQAKLLASDGADGDYFGASVALDGDTAIIGNTRNEHFETEGSAYVYTRTGGVWSEQAKLLAADGADGDAFGGRIELDGDTAVIGATLDDDNGDDAGSAYVFIRTVGFDPWTEQAKLLASDGEAGDFFGGPITLDGDTAIIGAVFDDDNGVNSGSAYVFIRSGGVWSQQAKLLASDGEAGDWFGNGVALNGDTAIIGTQQDDDNGNYSGSAYVFSLVGCSITVTDDGTGTLIWFTPESSEFEVVSGLLSELLADGGFSRTACLGTFSTSPAVDTLPGPDPGDARYYLANGPSCMSAGYGDSSVVPDPRDALDAGPCP